MKSAVRAAYPVLAEDREPGHHPCCEACGGATDEGLHQFALRREQIAPCPICSRGMSTVCTTAEARRLIFHCPQGHHHVGPLARRDDTSQHIDRAEA